MKRKGIALSKAEKSQKLINPVSSTGFYVSAYGGKELRIPFTLKLAGDLVLTFDKTQGAFGDVVCCRNREITDPFSIIVFVLVKANKKGTLKWAEIAVAFFGILSVTDMKEGIIITEEVGYCLVIETMKAL